MKIDFPIPDLPLNSYEVPRRISGRYLALECLGNAAYRWEMRDNPIGVARAVSRVVTTLRRVAEVNEWYDEEYHSAPRWSGRWHYCHECACDGRGTHTCTRENRAQAPCLDYEILMMRFSIITNLLGVWTDSCSAADVAYIEGIRSRQAEVYDRLAYHQRRASWV